MTQKAQSRDLVTFTCKYLENGMRWRLGTNYPLIGNRLRWNQRWRHRSRQVDPNILNARYFKNGSRWRLGYNGHLYEMACAVPNDHVTDDVTDPERFTSW